MVQVCGFLCLKYFIALSTGVAETTDFENLISLDQPIDSKIMPRWQRKQLQALASGSVNEEKVMHARRIVYKSQAKIWWPSLGLISFFFQFINQVGGNHDRFIPNRGSMDMEKAHYALSKENCNPSRPVQTAGQTTGTTSGTTSVTKKGKSHVRHQQQQQGSLTPSVCSPWQLFLPPSRLPKGLRAFSAWFGERSSRACLQKEGAGKFIYPCNSSPSPCQLSSSFQPLYKFRHREMDTRTSFMCFTARTRLTRLKLPKAFVTFLRLPKGSLMLQTFWTTTIWTSWTGVWPMCWQSRSRRYILTNKLPVASLLSHPKQSLSFLHLKPDILCCFSCFLGCLSLERRKRGDHGTHVRQRTRWLHLKP